MKHRSVKENDMLKRSIHYNHYERGFMGNYRPDIVIFQLVERQAYRFDQKML